MNNNVTCVVTGATSGIGNAIVREHCVAGRIGEVTRIRPKNDQGAHEAEKSLARGEAWVATVKRER